MADIKKLLESIDQLSERKAPISKPNNPVAKNAMATVGGGGYGKHKDKKKDEKVGKEKHKRSFMKDLAETAIETKELRKIKESWKQFQTEALDLSRLERYDPQTRKILRRMSDHENPGSWISAEQAYATQLGLQHKSQDPRGWEQDIQRFVDLWQKIVSEQGVAEENNELKEYGAQSTDPNAQTTNPAQQGGVTAPQQNKATQEYNQIQKNSPQQTGTQIDTTDDPDTFINFMKDPQFINTLKTNKSFADQLKKVFNSAGFK